jgi:hypothetical protein
MTPTTAAGWFWLVMLTLWALSALGVLARVLIIGPEAKVRRPHLPARTHHKPGHALGGPLAIAPPAPGVVYRANARSELVRQRAARLRREHLQEGAVRS